MNVLAFAGSLRSGSYNRSLIRAARELAPDGMEIEIFDLAPIPLYNADLDNDDDRPEVVERFKRAIADADALLISSPEYNHGVPGVLQNAIDWASRPGLKSVMKGKPVAIMGASRGLFGAARGQQMLKLVVYSTLALLMPHPGVAVGNSPDKFDEDGRLVHEPTREFVAKFLRELESWVERVTQTATA
mgnify:CR=1 FL=1